MQVKYDRFDVKFLVPVRILKKGFHIYFLNHSFHVGVRQISQKLIYESNTRWISTYKI